MTMNNQGTKAALCYFVVNLTPDRCLPLLSFFSMKTIFVALLSTFFCFSTNGAMAVLAGRAVLKGGGAVGPFVHSALTDNMIACWPLDEATGTREDDFGTFDLTDNNTVAGTTGPSGLGDASAFTAAMSMFLSHVDHASLRMGDFDTTFVVWANATTGGAASPTVISKDSDGSPGYTLNLIGSKYILQVHDGSVFNTVQSAATQPVNSGWHFIVFGYNSTTDRIFISVDNETLVTTAIAAPPSPGTGPFRIGDNSATDQDYNWQGSIAGAALWNRLLTAGEITTLWASGNGSRACEEPGN